MGYVVIDVGSGETLESSEEEVKPSTDRPDKYQAPRPQLQLELVIPSAPKNRNDRLPQTF